MDEVSSPRKFAPIVGKLANTYSVTRVITVEAHETATLSLILSHLHVQSREHTLSL